MTSGVASGLTSSSTGGQFGKSAGDCLECRRNAIADSGVVEDELGVRSWAGAVCESAVTIGMLSLGFAGESRVSSGFETYGRTLSGAAIDLAVGFPSVRVAAVPVGAGVGVGVFCPFSACGAFSTLDFVCVRSGTLAVLLSSSELCTVRFLFLGFACSALPLLRSRMSWIAGGSPSSSPLKLFGSLSVMNPYMCFTTLPFARMSLNSARTSLRIFPNACESSASDKLAMCALMRMPAMTNSIGETRVGFWNGVL